MPVNHLKIPVEIGKIDTRRRYSFAYRDLRCHLNMHLVPEPRLNNTIQ